MKTVQGGCNQTQGLEYRSVVKVETAILGRTKEINLSDLEDSGGLR